MALTGRLWALLAALGGALVFLATRPEPAPRWSGDLRQVPEVRAREHLQAHLGAAHERIILLEQRDAALARARSAASAATTPTAAAGASSLTLAPDPALPASVRDVVAAEARRQWALLRPEAGGVPVIVAALVDSVQSPGGLPRETTPRETRRVVFLPHATDGRSCLVLVRVGSLLLRQPADHHDARLRESLGLGDESSLLGPCAFLAAFGRPGPQVERWLRARSYDLAFRADWRQAEPVAWSTRRALHDRTLVSPKRAWEDETRGFYVSAAGIACLSGDLARCEQTVLDTADAERALWTGAWDRWAGRRTAITRAHASEGLGASRAAWRDYRTFEQWFLANAVHDLGRERFAQFWRSSLPPGEAFAAAAGVPLGEYVRRWALRVYGPRAIAPSRAPVLSLLASLAVGAIALGAVLVMIGRRTVG